MAAEKLVKLGVHTQTDEQFLLELEKYIVESRAEFQSEHASWHEQICEVLIKLMDRDNQNESIIRRLAFIPLRDGSWTSSEVAGNLLYFAHDATFAYPKTIRRRLEIHERVNDIPAQVKLFRRLGARDSTSEDLISFLVEEHKNFEAIEFRKRRFKVEDMVSQVQFLRRSGWNPRATEGLYCFTADEKISKSTDVYLPSDDRHSASYLAQKFGLPLCFIHPAYLQVEQHGSSNDIFLCWLETSMGFSRLLRATSDSNAGNGVGIHQDLLSFMGYNSMEVLLMLRHHWDHYTSKFSSEPLIPPSLASSSSPSSLLDNNQLRHSRMWHTRNNAIAQLENMEVTCHGGYRHSLKKTYLPSEDLMTLYHGSNSRTRSHRSRNCVTWFTETIKPKPRIQVILDGLLELPSEEGAFNPESWKFLKVFGVVVEPSLELVTSLWNGILGKDIPREQVFTVYQMFDKLENLTSSQVTALK